MEATGTAARRPVDGSRTPRSVILIHCVAAIAALGIWGHAAIGSVDDSPALAKVATMAAQVVGAQEAGTDRSSGRPTQPNCAESSGAAARHEREGTNRSSATVGCGIPGNLAGGTPVSDESEERVAVAVLLEWHLQARDSVLPRTVQRDEIVIPSE